MKLRWLHSLMAFVAVSQAKALTIQLDYSYDTANFFGSHLVAKTALEAAASSINSIIRPSLGAVPTDTFTGANGSTSATFNWAVGFSNPETGAPQTFDPVILAADTVRVYVGMRVLGGSSLGEGGPAGAGFSISGNGQASQWAGAVTNAQNASNATMRRGGGPIIGSLSGSSVLGGTTANFTVNYGALAGNLWFDSDSNNDGLTDSFALLSNYWHFDSAVPVAAGKNDFFSVALHELLHTLGFGASQTWDSLENGTNWAGAQAISANGGSGVGLISTDGHIAAGTMSRRLSDGILQETVMDPFLNTGTRSLLTELDAAFLRDLGYDAIPEPASICLLCSGAFLLLRRKRG